MPSQPQSDSGGHHSRDWNRYSPGIREKNPGPITHSMPSHRANYEETFGTEPLTCNTQDPGRILELSASEAHSGKLTAFRSWDRVHTGARGHRLRARKAFIMTSNPIHVSDEVRDAVAAGRPVVALESTIFTHGLPRPKNEELALATEQQVRDLGVVPATIGVVKGRPTVGLTADEIVALSRDDTAVKASLRDLPIAMGKGLSAGTTVAATGYLASLAGVRVFSTGGLGGVHQGAETSFDESADLGTLATLPLVVVSAGVKSILDIGLTLERLETLNLGVVGYRTNRYPGFYISDSGHTLDYEVESPEEIARITDARDALGIRSTLLVANPVPTDEQMDPELHDRVLRQAWAAAADQGISGHDTTPFLLDYITTETKGESMRANVVAYRGNVALGAKIAAALSEAGEAR